MYTYVGIPRFSHQRSLLAAVLSGMWYDRVIPSYAMSQRFTLQPLSILVPPNPAFATRLRVHPIPRSVSQRESSM